MRALPPSQLRHDALDVLDLAKPTKRQFSCCLHTALPLSCPVLFKKRPLLFACVYEPPSVERLYCARLPPEFGFLSLPGPRSSSGLRERTGCIQQPHSSSSIFYPTPVRGIVKLAEFWNCLPLIRRRASAVVVLLDAGV